MFFDDPRSAWNAAAPTNPITVPLATKVNFMNHYYGSTVLNLATKTHQDCLNLVKAIQTDHMNANGWSDIGYNGLVCQHGRTIEGRGIDVVGAHCPGYNQNGIGIMFMVGGSESPTDAAFDRMRALYDECVKQTGNQLSMLGHLDGVATDCPGPVILPWVRSGMPYKTVVVPPPVEEDPHEEIMEGITALTTAVTALTTQMTTLAETVTNLRQFVSEQWAQAVSIAELRRQLTEQTTNITLANSGLLNNVNSVLTSQTTAMVQQVTNAVEASLSEFQISVKFPRK